MKLQELRDSVLALPRRSRGKLLKDLILSLDEKLPSERTEKQWKEEIQRRLSAFESGEDPGISGEEFLEWIEKRANEYSSRKRRPARF